MEATGEKAIDAPRERVYNALHDPAVLKRILPSVQTATREGPDRIRLDTQTDMGNGSTLFVGQLEFYNEDPPAGYSVRGRMNGGDTGSLRGNAHIALASINEATTNLANHVSAEATGALAELPADVMERKTRALVDAFITNLAAYVEGDGAVTSQAAAKAAAAAQAAQTTVDTAREVDGPRPLVTTQRQLEPMGATGRSATAAGSAQAAAQPPRANQAVKGGYDTAYADDRESFFNDPHPRPDGFVAGPGYEPTPIAARDPRQPRVDTVPPADAARFRSRGKGRPSLRQTDADPGIGRWLLTALGVGIIAVLLSDMF